MSASYSEGEVSSRRYHHGDLPRALRDAARALLEEQGLAGLTLRGVAKRAGVSHAAPYRHFPRREALLVELAVEGFGQLREHLAAAACGPGLDDDQIAAMGAAYMSFVARNPALARLMFGSLLTDRASYPELAEAADTIGMEIGAVLNDPALGLAVWAAVHGLAMLILEDVIDLGQRRSGLQVLPSRAEILLRSLFVRAQR